VNEEALALWGRGAVVPKTNKKLKTGKEKSKTRVGWEKSINEANSHIGL
jgi:hypothetical protein